MVTTILRLPTVKARTGLSRSTIYLRMSDGVFPKPISLGGRAVGWIESDIQSWIEQRLTESRMDDQTMPTRSEHYDELIAQHAGKPDLRGKTNAKCFECI